MLNEKQKTTKSNCWPPGTKPDGRQDIHLQPTSTLHQFDSTAIPAEGLRQIRQAIRKKYAEVSISAEGKFRYLTGKTGAEALGYDQRILQDIKPELLSSFCGVGNPFSIDKIGQGCIVLDIGCGAGFDLIVASRLTGMEGKVYGIDLTAEMLARAKENCKATGVTNVELVQVDNEEIPFQENMFDVVISNGAINLSPNKLRLFQEIHRVLKPGGRFQFADIVTKNKLPAELTESLEAWTQWIGGTILVEDQISLIEQAGFSEVRHLGNTGTKTSQHTTGALFRAVKTDTSS